MISRAKRTLSSVDTWAALRLDRLAAPVYGGLGCIVALHRVRPREQRAALAFNQQLEITPGELEQAILHLRADGYTIVPLGELVEVLRSRRRTRGKVAVISLDDGYADVVEHALPVFKAYEAPFVLYVTTCFPDRSACLWWYALEGIIGRVTELVVPLSAGTERIPCGTLAEKNAAFDRIAPWLAFPPARVARSRLVEMASAMSIELSPIADARPLEWSEIVQLVREPLATLGAHTVTHSALAPLPEGTAIAEIRDSVRRLKEMSGVRPEHFAYPYGGRAAAGAREFRIASECGLASAVTTRHGNVFGRHRHFMHALPRLPLTSERISRGRRFLRLWTSGLAAARENRFRRVITS